MGVVRFSTGYRNHVLTGGPFKSAFQNGAIYGYSGAMPSSADEAPTGTNLIIFTTSSATRTAETLASGSVTLTGGSSGSVTSITVNSVQLLSDDPFDAAATSVAYNTSLTQTAADVVTQINKGTWWHRYTATSSGAVITLKPIPGFGDSVNGHTVAFTGSTITATTSNMASGVDPANGLKFGNSASGALTKDGTWSGAGITDGSLGYIRFVGSQADAGGSSTTLIRMDMDAATAAAFFNLSSTTIATGATVTIDTATFTEQATVTG